MRNKDTEPRVENLFRIKVYNIYIFYYFRNRFIYPQHKKYFAKSTPGPDLPLRSGSDVNSSLAVPQDGQVLI